MSATVKREITPFRRFAADYASNKIAVVALVGVVIIVFLALFANLIAPPSAGLDPMAIPVSNDARGAIVGVPPMVIVSPAVSPSVTSPSNDCASLQSNVPLIVFAPEVRVPSAS